jgi:hypothetical protein
MSRMEKLFMFLGCLALTLLTYWVICVVAAIFSGRLSV